MLNWEADLSRATVKQSVVFWADVHLQEESADTDGPVGKTSRTDMSTFLSDSHDWCGAIRKVQRTKSFYREVHENIFDKLTEKFNVKMQKHENSTNTEILQY